MPFIKAVPVERRLKTYIFGKAGAGKTMAAVQFIDPAVYDMEHKAMSFSDTYTFDVMEPSYVEPADVLNELYTEIENLQQNPGNYKTLVIDSASTYTDLLIDKHLRRLREKTGNPNYLLKPLDYKIIKAEVKSFVNRLMLLDMNVVLTARSRNQYDPDSGEMMKVIGTEPDAHKEFTSLFHIVLELVGEGPMQPRTAYVRRDNTRKLPEVIEDFSFPRFLDYFKNSGYNITGQAQAVTKTTERRQSARSIQVSFRGKLMSTAGVTGITLEKLFTLVEKEIIREEDLHDKIRIDYPGAESLLDLKEDEAQMLFKDLNGELDIKEDK
ncbi:MAG: AAA family ATPase [Candidatus Pacearchaeota archaeon]